MFKNYLNRVPTMIDEESYKKYAVFLPLIEEDGEYHILFEVRAFHMRRQPGEVCFPGGKIDETDLNAKVTALRETQEELGFEEGDMEQVFPLDYFFSPFGTIIYPYAGIIKNKEKMKLNQSEVAEVFSVPLAFFMSREPEKYKINFKVEPEKEFPFESIIGGENYNWQIRQMDELFYYYEDRTIWGLTANILKNFIDIIKNDRGRK